MTLKLGPTSVQSSEILAARTTWPDLKRPASQNSDLHIMGSSADAPWGDLVRVEHLRALPPEDGVCPLWDTVTMQIGPGTFEQRSERGSFRKMVVTSGDIQIFPAGVAVYARSKLPIECLSIQLGPDIVSTVCDEPVNTLFPKGWRLFRDPQIERIGMLFETEIRLGCPSGRLYGESLGIALASYLKHRSFENANTSKQSGKLPDLPGQKLNMILEYMRAHATENISLKELATLAQLSPYYFCRLFKQRVGVPPHTCVLQFRIEQAKQQLLSSDVDIATLGLRLGFKDQSHFTSTFRKMTGTTPNRWRRGVI